MTLARVRITERKLGPSFRVEVLVDGEVVGELPVTGVGWERKAGSMGHVTLTLISEDVEVHSRGPQRVGVAARPLRPATPDPGTPQS